MLKRSVGQLILPVTIAQVLIMACSEDRIASFDSGSDLIEDLVRVEVFESDSVDGEKNGDYIVLDDGATLSDDPKDQLLIYRRVMLPVDGEVNAVVVNACPADPTRIFVGTGSFISYGAQFTGKGLFVSENKGDSFSKVDFQITDSKGDEFDTIDLIVFQPDDPDRILVVARSGEWGGNETRLLSSQDGGLHWGSQGLDFFPVSMAMAPGGQVVYATVNLQGVFVSEDGGKTWARRNTGIAGEDGMSYTDMGNVVVDPKDPGHAVTFRPAAGLYRTNNAGMSWEWILEEEGTKFVALFVDIFADIYLFTRAQLNSESSPPFLRRSKDFGDSFEIVDPYQKEGFCYGGFFVDTNAPNRMAAVAQPYLCYSFDGGKSWNKQDFSPWVNDVLFLDDRAVLSVLGGGGVVLLSLN